MANAVQDALDRASKSQGFKEAQEALKTNNVSLSQNDNRAAPAPANNNSVENAFNRASAQDKQAIEATKSQLSEIKDTHEVTPQNTPTNRIVNSREPQLSANTQENIESAQQGPGNNHLYPNAIDRALVKPAQEPQKNTPEQGKER